MADPRATPWHHTLQPPPYLGALNHDEARWDRPVQTNRQQLDQYEKDRAQGAPRTIDMEPKLIARRQRQVAHHLRASKQQP